MTTSSPRLAVDPMNGMTCLVRQIVAGGQTGADRCALDWAIAHRVAHGGYCPKGRRAEDGVIAIRYHLTETPLRSYRQRTEWNVRDSDGTVIFTVGKKLRGGSRRASEFAMERRKPCLHISRTIPREECVSTLRSFILGNAIKILNVAGSRGSEEPEIGEFVHDVMSAALLTSSYPARES